MEARTCFALNFPNLLHIGAVPDVGRMLLLLLLLPLCCRSTDAFTSDSVGAPK